MDQQMLLERLDFKFTIIWHLNVHDCLKMDVFYFFPLCYNADFIMANFLLETITFSDNVGFITVYRNTWLGNTIIIFVIKQVC